MMASSPSNGSGDSVGSARRSFEKSAAPAPTYDAHAPQREVDAVGLHLDLGVDQPFEQRRLGGDTVEDGASIEQARHNVGILYRLRGPLAKAAVSNGGLRVLA